MPYLYAVFSSAGRHRESVFFETGNLYRQKQQPILAKPIG